MDKRVKELLETISPEETLDIKIQREGDRIILIADINDNEPVAMDYTGDKEGRIITVETCLRAFLSIVA